MKEANFNLSKIKTLSPLDAKSYITKYFIPLDNGNHAMLIDGVYKIKDDQELKRSYFNRMQKELYNYYFREYTEVKSITYAINKPLFFDDKINLCPPLKWNESEKSVCSSQTQIKLSFFLEYLRTILCSSNIPSYNFLLSWLSNVVKGNKNNSCLYLKGIQGTGKSTLFNFLSNHVIGNMLCLETGSDPIRTKFNEILGGKLLVCIEELENFTKGEWESISSTLKRMITSTNITLQNKCTKAYESTNMNNYILCSNNDAIKDDDGRRYFILDIATCKVGDREYYTKLYESFDDKVGEAFYHFLLEIPTENFNPQAFPYTQSKQESLSKRLDPVYKFIKDSYILANKDIQRGAMDLYMEFKSLTFSKMSKEDFHRKLVEAGIERTKKGNKLWYSITNSQLIQLARKSNWLNELDEFEAKPFENALPTYIPKPTYIEPFEEEDDNVYTLSYEEVGEVDENENIGCDYVDREEDYILKPNKGWPEY